MFVPLLILFLICHGDRHYYTMAKPIFKLQSTNVTLQSVRDSLIRQEDSIVFSLIERAKFPANSPTYDASYASFPGGGSLLHFIVQQSEALQAKAGRYTNPEENPFFPDNLPTSIVPAYNFPQVLNKAATSININNPTIWDIYVNKLLPLLAAPGDDGNYAATAASDLVCLQALSRRIHYGKFVAETKYMASPNDYEPAIRSKDNNTLMNLLTVASVEEEVKQRVAKKATVFGQQVTLNGTGNTAGTSKVDPSVVSRVYGDWVIPLTKQVEVEYLLRRVV